MAALFRGQPRDEQDPNWTKIDGRRSAPVAARLCAGIFLRYSKATGAKEFDTFHRDAKTWAAFENAALPELANFTFFDASRHASVTAAGVLADAMYHLWTVSDLGRDLDGRPTTICVVKEVANYLCAVYETKPRDRRMRTQNSAESDSAN